MKRYSILAAFVALLVGLFIGSHSTPSQKLTASDPAEVGYKSFVFDEPCDKCDCPTIDTSSFATKDELADLRTELFAELNKRLPAPVVVESRPVVMATPVVSSAPVVSSSYKARWTYPSTIENHMATDHGVSVAGKSKAQLLAEHDAIHDASGPSYSTKTNAVTRTRSTVSSCPGGVCPTGPSQSYSRPMFRLFRR